MVIFYFSSTLIAVFLAFAAALGYQAYLTVHGITFALAITILAVQSILSIIVLIHKVKQHRSNSKGTTIWDIIMTLLAAAAALFTAYIFASDVRSYGDGFFDMICFIIGFLFCGGIWLFSTIEYAAATLDEGFDYVSFLKGLLLSAILFAVAYLL